MYHNSNWQQHHFLINKNCVKKHKKVTYGKFVAEIKTHKQENHRVRLTVVGYGLYFEGVNATHCASLSTANILVNIIISTPGGNFMNIDLNDFHYGTPMEKYEFMPILLFLITQ